MFDPRILCITFWSTMVAWVEWIIIALCSDSSIAFPIKEQSGQYDRKWKCMQYLPGISRCPHFSTLVYDIFIKPHYDIVPGHTKTSQNQRGQCRLQKPAEDKHIHFAISTMDEHLLELYQQSPPRILTQIRKNQKWIIYYENKYAKLYSIINYTSYLEVCLFWSTMTWQ